MSTHNIPGLTPGRNSMGRIARAVRARADEVREGLAALDNEEENVQIGAAAMLQDIENERTPLVEEAEQLLGILSAGQTAPAPVAPATTPAPTAPTPTAPAPRVTRPNWGSSAWVGAIIGAIVGIVVGANSRDWLANDVADLTTGFGAWLIKFVWIVATTACGFYATGFIISAATNRARPTNPNPGP